MALSLSQNPGFQAQLLAVLELRRLTLPSEVLTEKTGKCWSSPAFSDGQLYVRSTKEAVRLDLEERGE